MTSLTDTQVITASGGLVELGYSQITSNVTVNGTDVTVIGDLTVVCDGSPVWVEFFTPRIDNGGTTTADGCEVYLSMDGTKQGRIVDRYHPVAATGPYVTGYGARRLTPSAGSHTFRVTANRTVANATISAGSGGTGFAPAFLRVSKIVQATQWPAVTTGTIICTSSTRPSTPFEGQRIYETDTDRELVWNAAAWVSPQSVTKAPACRLRLTSNLAVSGGSYISWQANSGSNCFDNASMWSAGDSTKITIPVSGVYHISFGGTLSSTGSTNFRYSPAIILNTGQALCAGVWPGMNSPPSGSGVISSIAQLTAGDYLRVIHYTGAEPGQTVPTGLSLNVNLSTFFAAALLTNA